ncbi:MAG TPA: metallophosphoesterase [Xanthobacteraceae bacterium]|nr:metallophosphoesterase [Xanthobacteraceae bacterium]
MFTLAHISDPHLAPDPGPRLAELMGKRALGHLNWRLRRARRHRPEALDALVADLKAQPKDHTAVTGDLVVLSLAHEFAPAEKFLRRLGPPKDVTLVPGNHDAYVRATEALHREAWAEYLAGDTPGAEMFPFVRRRGPIALVGVSTALPTLPFLATGRVGKAQLARLAEILPALDREGLFRVILIHHPPAGRRSPHEMLTDAPRFRALIRQHGAELILHGHDHAASRLTIAGPEGAIPVIGVPSASHPPGHERAGAYNLYRIEGKPGDVTVEMESRGFTRDGGVGVVGRVKLK